jgi:hypothetical protein
MNRFYQLLLLAAVLAVGSMLGLLPKGRTEADAAADRQKKIAACGDDLKCLAEAVRIDAKYACRDDIERRAKHSFEWTDRDFFSWLGR